MNKRKLIKFDIIHPTEYLEQKQKEWTDINEISLEEYRQRLIKLRSNYSDFYTYHLNKTGRWEAEEFFLLDNVFLEKVAKELFGKEYTLQRFLNGRNRTKRKFIPKKWRDYVLHKYIEAKEPDVIFARSQPIPSQFWQKYRKNSLLVARLSARLPFNWHPNHWDIIYTDQPDFKKFFDLHGVTTIINNQGFDRRIPKELKSNPIKKDIVFIGGLGTENFRKRTLFLNNIVKKIEGFKWWGYWWKFGGDGRNLADFPNLKKTFQGSTSGLEMFQIYRDSFVIINDYVDTANGIGFNQRMFEVMGSGGFMLTREAPNFKEQFPDNIFATYKDEKELFEKINYYLDNRTERDKIAQKGQEFVLEKFDYKEIVQDFENDLLKALNVKEK
ncbi:glycosyltransferase [Salegentibacter sp. Hel_I_6]|uniref:glycosyltransferase family protein n=1 Tax=Salegentibacter sp. Hel_I_6 TaxID=1250278 RepID=UPI0005681F8A|nr:glycosyltransferase [Salegentibacter sp. Hel_I_6]